MPETNEREVPTISQPSRKRNERTEVKYFEDIDKIIAEVEHLGADYAPPNPIASVVNLKAKRDAALAVRAVNQANDSAEEIKRNDSENPFKPLNSDVSSLVNYAKSYGLPENQIAALQSIARDVKGGRAKPIDPESGGNHISVSHLSYATRADNYAQFIEQFDALAIPTTEDMYKPATHRAKLTALRNANSAVITAEANSNTSGETLDKLAYTDADSLMNACIPAKGYIKSKYKTTGQPYKNIAKTRFEMPTRLRKKK